MSGWVKLHRKLVENELWKSKEPFCERAAWVDLIMRANWSDNENKKIPRGCLPFSYRSLASRWGWSLGRVQRFVKRLKSDTLIDTESIQNRYVLRVKNYDKYQDVNGGADTLPDTRSDTKPIPPIRTIQEIRIQEEELNPFIPLKGEIGVEIPKKEKPRKKLEIPYPEHWCKESREALDSWLKYKREKGQGYKPQGLKTLIARWADMPEAFARAVESSMSSNYAGLFSDNGSKGSALKMTAAGRAIAETMRYRQQEGK